MKKVFFFAAVALVALASCSDETFVGDVTTPQDNSPSDSVAIVFSSASKGITRADIVGNEAAAKLGNNFYVMGTKGNAETATPSLTKVFDNYLVRYTENTSGKTQSNTANWEYVGVAADANHVKLSPANVTNQTIKFWDYSQTQYDFLAFSTGTWKALKTTTPNAANEEIGVTSIASGATLGSNAYTFYLPSTDALQQTYITDIVKVEKANYGKEVTLQFKNLGSKVRLALYETVPGYSIEASSVKFYALNASDPKDFTDANKSTTAKLISSDANTFAGSGTVQVKFPNMGTSNLTNSNYNKATATVTGIGGGDTKKSFGALDDNTKAVAEGTETAGKIYIGRTLPNATFAGSKAADYYQTVFPISNSYPLTLRVDYTLISTDGSGETIDIYGAKAVIPSNYTVWQPNYAYTYIFKISDNTNGWTSPTASTDGTDPGLFPITFDAVVAEATDASGEQTTVSTIATPSIITYQQGHTYATDEYSKTTKGKDNEVRKLYVMVMHNEGSPEAHPVGSTYASCPHPILSSTTALLYKIDKANATEAEVMDALENRTTNIAADNVTGRNNITLTKNSHISAVSTIVNGVDDNPITIASGHGNAAEIDIANAEVTTGTYAFVYDYTDGSKTTTTFYQPKTVAEASIPNGTRYITTAILNGIATTTSDGEAVNSNGFLYFSKTTDGTGTTTYSYYSVDGKTTLPAGLLKVAINDSNLPTSDGSAVTSTAAFIFDVYTRNTGKYAVKVIKIIA